MSASIPEITIVAAQQPGVVSFDNYLALRDQLQEVNRRFMSIEYGPGDYSAAESDLKLLRKAKTVLKDAKKALKEGYTKPYMTVEEQLDELIALLKEPEDRLGAFVKDIKRSERRAEVEEYARGRAAVLGGYSAQVLGSPRFFDARWLNSSKSAKAWRAEVDAAIDRARDDIEVIQQSAGEKQPEALAHYFNTLSLESVMAFLDTLKESAGCSAELGDAADEGPIGFKTLKIFATERAMLKLMDMLEMSGLEYEELEDGMPRHMVELAEPPAGDYVCFDIETTGTFGAASGDADAEITEIGAVRVVGGAIVERFDMLANPGRKIVPRIARLTHIDDAMVAGEPPVDEVIARFAEFCKGYPLVGHNVKSCDIPHIARAAKRAGIALENEYFDSYQYAKRLKQEQGWENVKLGYLSEQFGLEHEEAHRAWCDAQANVGVFEQLKKLGEEARL